MSFVKDKIIGDLQRENDTLRCQKTCADTWVQDLRAKETTLKFSIEERVIWIINIV